MTRETRLAALMVVASILPVLTGCQQATTRDATPVVVASQLAAQLDTATPIAPPPRSIIDLTALLDQPEYQRPAAVAALRAIADAPTPPGADGAALGEFLMERATAARYLGRHRQAVADVEQALPLVPGDRSAYVRLYNTYDELGDHEAAARYARLSLDASNRRGQQVVSASLLSVALSTLGDLEGAEQALTRARGYLSGASYNAQFGPFWDAKVAIAAGSLAAARGRYAEADKHYVEALEAISRYATRQSSGKTLFGQSQESFVTLQRTYYQRLRTQALVRDQRLPEAETLAREVVATQAGSFGRASGQTAEGLQSLTEVLGEQGRFEDAALIAREAIRAFESIGADSDSVTVATANRALADALVGVGRGDEALTLYERIAGDLAPQAADRVFGANLSWVLAALAGERSGAAIARLERIAAAKRRDLGADHVETAEAGGLLGCLYAAAGRTADAMTQFQVAVPVLQRRLTTTVATLEAGQRARARRVLECRLDALPAEPTPAAVEEAFLIASAAQQNRVTAALQASSARASFADPVLAMLAREERDAALRIAALERLLVPTGGGGAEGARRRRVIEQEMNALRQTRRGLLDKLQASHPDYLRLVEPMPLGFAAVRERLQPGELLLMVYTTARRSYVFALPRQGEVGFAVAPLGRAALSRIVDRLRGALAPDAETLGEIPPFDVGLAHELYTTLFGPLARVLEPSTRLLTVTEGALATLPLAVLVTEPTTLGPETAPLFSRYGSVAWLARKFAVAGLPSVSSLAAQRMGHGDDDGRRPFVAFADPVFGPLQGDRVAAPARTTSGDAAAVRGAGLRLRSLPDTRGEASAGLASLPPLPDTADEVRSIGNALGATAQDIHLRAQANETAVKSLSESGALAGYRVVSFATHGLVPGDLDGLVEPALALSDPTLSASAGDGLLTMSEVLGLHTDADWVLLSACNTGAADGAGAESASGLGRAFFYAGARSLLVSNWPVHSAATRELMGALFAQSTAMSRAEKLRSAMLSLVEDGAYRASDGSAVFSYAHPLFWGAFSLFGEGG